jgi:salicylate hydroxylase
MADSPRRVRERNILIRMGCEVTSFDDSDPTPSLTLASGEVMTADVIVAADGIKSLARHLVLGARDDPVSSGYACFRAYFEPSEEMKADPSRNAFLGGDNVNFWIGPDVHVVQNTLRGGREFNWYV